MSRQETTKKKNSKTIIFAVLLFLLAIVLLIEWQFAFFSDFVSTNITGTAGTLDLTSSSVTATRYYMQGGTEGSDTGTTIANLNPGDIVDVSYTVLNEGNKSAWTRDVLTLTLGANYTGVTIPPVSGAFELYPSTATNANIRAGTATPLITATVTNGFQYATDGSTIINGTGTGAETETGGQTGPIAVSYKLYFKPTAGNEYQQVAITYEVKTQAMQYRNNPTPDWNDIVTTTFSL